MKNKLFILISLISFSSLSHAALEYEVRGVERSSNMFGEAICVSLYIVSDSRKSYEFNLFAIEARGDGLSAMPSVLVTKSPEFNPNATLTSGGKVRGWLCFDEPEYGWTPEQIEFSSIFESAFLTVQVN